MKQYDNTNRGALWRNDRKETDNHPDYTGNINVGGKEFWLSGWKKQTSKGVMLSLSVKPKETGMRVNLTTAAQDMDDEVPF